MAQTSGLSLYDSGAFQQMGEIAVKLATSSLIPETLRGKKEGQRFIAHPPEQVAANCFRIVEQAHRWGMSPFAVVDCASVVHGKLMWEGKLVAAALEATMGIRLDYEYSGSGENREVIVLGKFPNEDKIKTVEGTVADWKTSQWKGSAYDQRLAYRGAREWARRYAPAAILGVYAPDEMDDSKMRDANQSSPGLAVRESYQAPKPKEVEAEVEIVKETPEPSPHALNAPDEENPAKKKPVTRNVMVDAVTEKPCSNDRTRFSIKLNIGAKSVTVYTFSTRLGKNAQELIDCAAVAEIDHDQVTKENKLVGIVPEELSQEGGLV